MISVVIPVFNREQFLQEALDSVYAQDTRPLEVIVVDDGSTDGTAAIARRQGSRILYIRQPNGGAASAVNAGIRRAQGDLISVLDSDDWWAPGMIAGLCHELAADPETDIVVGRTTYVRHGAVVGSPAQLFSFGASLIRRQVFERVGYQDESLRFTPDADWYLRALEAGVRVRCCSVPALFYRGHDANLTSDRAAALEQYVTVLKRSISRRRQPNGSVAALPSVSWRMS